LRWGLGMAGEGRLAERSWEREGFCPWQPCWTSALGERAQAGSPLRLMGPVVPGYGRLGGAIGLLVPSHTDAVRSPVRGR
jgi:hypothetical protein